MKTNNTSVSEIRSLLKGAVPKAVEATPFGTALITAVTSALDAVDPLTATAKQIDVQNGRLTIGEREFNLEEVNRIRVLGGGKGTLRMAEAVHSVLGERIEAGCIAVKADPHTTIRPIGNISVITARHPVPDIGGQEAATRIMALARDLRQTDLAIVLISGGASSLLTLPAPPLTLSDLGKTTTELLRVGADIESVNTVRKHLSAIKGGRLMSAIYPANAATLILSDVVGDAVSAIGSGPTVPDPGTFEDALAVLNRFDLLNRIPKRVKERLIAGTEGNVSETPKATDPIFHRSFSKVIGSGAIAANAAVRSLIDAGIHAVYEPTPLVGDAKEAAKRAVQRIDAVSERPAAVVFSGETTVTVEGEGKGGRNQELALAAAFELQGRTNTLILTLATDGGDGPTDAAGAVATADTVERARQQGLDAKTHLRNNDAYTFFAALDDLLITGPTQTNVADLTIVLSW